jgi:cyclase
MKIAQPIVAILFMCLSAFPQNRDYSKVEMKITKVAGSVYLLQGAGGNIGLSVGEDGVVVVDDEFEPLVPKIRAAIAGITAKPLRFIINTHWHGDHVGGNRLLGETTTIIAHDNVRKRMESGANVLGNKVEPAVKTALPVITFDNSASVHLNGEDIRALHIANGHTDGDAVIFFPKSNVVHMGDDFVTYGFPFVDLESGGSVRGMIAGLEQLIPQIPADAKIIPGHGPLSNLEDVKNFLQMLKDTSAAVRAAIAQGKTVEQMKEQKVLAPWQKYSGDFVNSDKFIETIYNDETHNSPKG